MFARSSGAIVRITLDIHTNEMGTLCVCSFRFMYTRSNNNNRLGQVQAQMMNKHRISQMSDKTFFLITNLNNWDRTNDGQAQNSHQGH